MVEHKFCKGPCGESKPRTEFYKHKGFKDGLWHICKECYSLRMKEYRTPDKMQSQRRRRTWGISDEEWKSILAFQDYTCPICQRVYDDEVVPCVDHDHETGRIRGIICKRCNAGLGMFGDSKAILVRAVDFLA